MSYNNELMENLCRVEELTPEKGFQGKPCQREGKGRRCWECAIEPVARSPFFSNPSNDSKSSFPEKKKKFGRAVCEEQKKTVKVEAERKRKDKSQMQISHEAFKRDVSVMYKSKRLSDRKKSLYSITAHSVA
ncbi:hypothetical protein RUM44_002153 [Polyplax serrata]|uniref:Uncharacterized protein n=1 Tax=Polyplax serrata TaxID=468196 RepID=A0ABR1AMQ9_POLSC